VYAAAWTAPPAASTRRREQRSDSAPDGTSVTRPVTDQIASNAAISAADMPESAKNNAYRG